jgi:hypothetical protein
VVVAAAVVGHLSLHYLYLEEAVEVEVVVGPVPLQRVQLRPLPVQMVDSAWPERVAVVGVGLSWVLQLMVILKQQWGVKQQGRPR